MPFIVNVDEVQYYNDSTSTNIVLMILQQCMRY